MNVIKMEQNLQIHRCPGKVLLVGGHAILNDSNHGLSLATQKYMYTAAVSKPSNSTEIHFQCCQFQTTWSYTISEASVLKQQTSENVYLEAICSAFAEDLQLFNEIKNKRIHVHIFVDSAFYDPSLPMFSLLGSLGKCSKTGLGSSSALIVACLKALLPNVSVELALKINFAAQQKVGSGFDIATCLKGSIIYKKPMDPFYLSYGHLQPYHLKKGQNTVKSATSIAKHFAENPELHKHFLEQSEECFNGVLHALKTQDIESLKSINKRYRQLQRLVAPQDCQIEPEVATAIIDNLMQNDEVVFGICPGAGGYDAIAFVTIADIMDLTKFQTQLDELATKTGKIIEKYSIFELGIDQQGLIDLLPSDPIYQLLATRIVEEEIKQKS